VQQIRKLLHMMQLQELEVQMVVATLMILAYPQEQLEQEEWDQITFNSHRATTLQMWGLMECRWKGRETALQTELQPSSLLAGPALGLATVLAAAAFEEERRRSCILYNNTTILYTSYNYNNTYSIIS
jgi:hypothetical protein